MKILRLHIIIFVLFFLVTNSLFAQFDPDSVFNAIKGKMEGEFESFRQETEEIFNEFVKKNDEAFSNLLKQSWKDFDLDTEQERDNSPKPVDPPSVEPTLVEENETDVVPVEEPEETKDIYEPQSPLIKRVESEDFMKSDIEVDFYGSKLDFSYDKSFVNAVPSAVNSNVISDFWDNMIQTKHYHFIDQLMNYKTTMNLNDWGYYLMVKNVCDRIAPASENTSKLLTWFFLTKSRYKLKVGYTSNNVYLLMHSNNMMYGKPYYTFGTEKYYVLDKNIGRIRTYTGKYPDANSPFDFDISEPLNIGDNIDTKILNFYHSDKDYEFNVEYNLNNVNFYKDYPLVDLKIYFDAAGSPYIKESLIEYLRPLVQGKSEYEAVSIILEFAQKAFPYKTDDAQFGQEKFFFPDEIFYYPFSDCEDRSILFAYLVKELLELEVVGLEYPGHMCTAVRFNDNVDADYFMYKGKRYTICDPTYMGAAVGMCMPQFLSTQGKIIELSNRKAKTKVKKDIWDVVNESGAFKASTESDMVFDDEGNTYVTGFFTGKAKFGDLILKSESGGNGFFVAKYDNNKNLVWVRQSMSTGNSAGTAVAIDKEGNVYVTGTYDQTTIVGNIELPSNGVMDIFVAKYSGDGKFMWANKLAIEAEQTTHDLIYVSYFSSEGVHQTTLSFDETPNFDNYGIKLDEQNNVFVTASFQASTGELAFVEDKKVESSATFSHEAVWKAEFDRLLTNNYDRAIAGLFAFMKTMKVNGNSVSGKTIQEAFDRYNPNFRKAYPTIYNNIGRISMVKNNGGIITLNTQNRADIEFAELIIKDNTKLKITTYKGGNAQINFLNGASVGKAFIRFDLNFVKMLKNTGDLVIDYDDDHSQKKMNLKRDILD